MSDLKNSFGIRPYPRVAHYATGWAGCRTFDEIYADLTPNLNRLLRYYGNADIDIPDLVAHAFMRLWIDLSADITLLAGVDKGGAEAALEPYQSADFPQGVSPRGLSRRPRYAQWRPR